MMLYRIIYIYLLLLVIAFEHKLDLCFPVGSTEHYHKSWHILDLSFAGVLNNITWMRAMALNMPDVQQIYSRNSPIKSLLAYWANGKRVMHNYTFSQKVSNQYICWICLQMIGLAYKLVQLKSMHFKTNNPFTYITVFNSSKRISLHEMLNNECKELY